MYHIIFWRKHELSAVSLTSTHYFPPFEEVFALFSIPHFSSSEAVMIISSFVLFMEYLTLQVVWSYNLNARATVNCVCFLLFKSKRTCTYSLSRHEEVSLLSWNCESKTGTTNDVWRWIILMITICDLIDQFPNFNCVQKSDVHNLKEFSPDLLKFSILRFYNDEKKHRCFFHCHLNQLWLVSIDSLC